MSVARPSHLVSGPAEDGAPPDLSIVIPLYRDEDALGPIFDRCGAILDGVDSGELVLVDDGGLDRTTPRAIALAEDYRHPVTLVQLARNFGQHPAVFAGLAHARGQRVVTLDSDLQYPPEDIPLLLDAMSEDFPVTSGFRADRKDPWSRRLITRILTGWLNRQTGASLQDFGSMFRAYDRHTVDLMLTLTERHRYVPAVVAWLGVPIKEVPISHAPRGAQGSRYRPMKLAELMLDLITGYSVFPLRLATMVGLIGSAAGFVGTCGFAVYRLVVGGGVSGTVSAFALLFALVGLQLLIVALIGEYVGRIYTEAQARPYYLVGNAFRSAGTGAPTDLADERSGLDDPNDRSGPR